MAWRGFLIESKHWMSYPSCGRWKFWRQFPFALVRYGWFTFVGSGPVLRLRVPVRSLLLLLTLIALPAFAKWEPCPSSCTPPTGTVSGISRLPLYAQPVRFLREVKMAGMPMWEWAKTTSGPTCTPAQLAERSDKVACAAPIGGVVLVTVRAREVAARVSSEQALPDAQEPAHCPLRMPDSYYTSDERERCAAYDATIGRDVGPRVRVVKD